MVYSYTNNENSIGEMAVAPFRTIAMLPLISPMYWLPYNCAQRADIVDAEAPNPMPYKE